MSNKKIKKMKRFFQFMLWIIGVISGLLFTEYPTLAIVVAVVGSLVANVIISLQVIWYKSWHEFKPGNFWIANSLGAGVALLIIILFVCFDIMPTIPKQMLMISMMVVIPSVTPIIGVLVGNILRVIRKEKPIFID